MLSQKLTASLSDKLKQERFSNYQITYINYYEKFYFTVVITLRRFCVFVRPRIAQNDAIKLTELKEFISHIGR